MESGSLKKTPVVGRPLIISTPELSGSQIRSADKHEKIAQNLNEHQKLIWLIFKTESFVSLSHTACPSIFAPRFPSPCNILLLVTAENYTKSSI